jgi:hypothetical protein
MTSPPSHRSLDNLPQRLDQVQSRRLVLLEVDQELGQLIRVRTLRQPTDQRSAVGLGASKDVEQLTGTPLTHGGDTSPIAAMIRRPMA